jgi:hypothetical protein
VAGHLLKNVGRLAATAPPTFAGQETAGREGSRLAISGISRRSVAGTLLPRARCLVAQCQNRARRMMIGIGTSSSQSRMPLPIARSHGDLALIVTSGHVPVWNPRAIVASLSSLARRRRIGTVAASALIVEGRDRYEVAGV